MITAAEVAAIRDTMQGFISADVEMLESLAIVTGTAEALSADERAESAWEARELRSWMDGDYNAPSRE